MENSAHAGWLKCLACRAIDGDSLMQCAIAWDGFPASAVAGHTKNSAAYARIAGRLFNVHTHLIL